MNNIDKKLHTLRGESLSQVEREAVWNSLATQLPEQTRQPWYKRIGLFAMQPTVVPIFVMAIVLIGGSAATVAASDKAKPGDFLYPLDRTVEKIHLQLTLSAEKKDDLKVQFAEERIVEVEEILDAETRDEQVHNQTAPSSDEDTLEIAYEQTSTTTATTTSVEVTNNTRNTSQERVAQQLQKVYEHVTELQTELTAAGNTRAAERLDRMIERFKERIQSQRISEKIKFKMEHEDESEFEFEYEYDDDHNTQNNDSHKEDMSNKEVEIEVDGNSVKIKNNQSVNVKTNTSVEVHSNSENNDITSYAINTINGKTHISITYNGESYEFAFEEMTEAAITKAIAQELGISEAAVQDMIHIEIEHSTEDSSDDSNLKDAIEDMTNDIIGDVMFDDIEVNIHEHSDEATEVQVEFISGKKQEFRLDSKNKTEIIRTLATRYDVSEAVIEEVIDFD